MTDELRQEVPADTQPVDTVTAPVPVVEELEPPSPAYPPYLDEFVHRPMSGPEAREYHLRRLAARDGFLEANDMLNQTTVASNASEEEIQAQLEEEAEGEPYEKPFFFTNWLSEIRLPLLFMAALVYATVLVSSILTSSETTQNQLNNFYGALAFAYIGNAWWLARQFALGKYSYIKADQSKFSPVKPRILWLGLLGSQPGFNTFQMEVIDLYPSFWNFIPGWNSWVIELDTAAQADKKIQRFEHVVDGDKLALVIRPDAAPRKRRLFRR